MRDHAREAVDMLGGRTLDEVSRDRKLQLALVRLVEIVGEAATRVPVEVKTKHPNVPWREAAGMRNKLVHEYDYVDIAVVYNTIRNDLAPLVEKLNQLFG